MHRYIGIAVAVAVVAFTVIVWAKSGPVVAPDAGSTASISPYDLMVKTKDLPVRQVDEPF